MIDLINRDYADFVNLSSNLIGLDKAINGIQIPLGQLKEEVLVCLKLTFFVYVLCLIKSFYATTLNHIQNCSISRKKLHWCNYSKLCFI